MSGVVDRASQGESTTVDCKTRLTEQITWVASSWLHKPQGGAQASGHAQTLAESLFLQSSVPLQEALM